MATSTNQELEQKKLRLKQLAEEAEQLKNELVEAGAWPMDDEDLEQAAGGYAIPHSRKSGQQVLPEDF